MFLLGLPKKHIKPLSDYAFKYMRSFSTHFYRSSTIQVESMVKFTESQKHLFDKIDLTKIVSAELLKAGLPKEVKVTVKLIASAEGAYCDNDAPLTLSGVSDPELPLS